MVTVASEHISSFLFFFSSRRRHTRLQGDWSSDVCSSDLEAPCRFCARSARGLGLGPAAGVVHEAQALHEPPTHPAPRAVSFGGTAAWRPSERRGHLSESPEIGRASCRERG